MRNVHLEQIRGIAALIVFLGHLTKFNGASEALGSAIMLLNWGTESVLVFFLLSGTVIRLSMNSNPKTRLQFLKHRIARIVPLYIIAIILTIFVSFLAGNSPGFSVIVGNLLFLQTLQGYICPTIWSNAALWSLSFEAFFYLVYALTIGKHQKNLLLAWIIASIIAIIIQYFLPLSGILGHLTIMFAYSSIWLLGYYLVDIQRYIRVNLSLAYAWLALLPIISRLHFSDNYYLVAKHFMVVCSVVPLFVFLISQHNQQDKTRQDKTTRFQWLLWVVVFTITLIFNFRSQSLFLSKIIYAFLPLLIFAGDVLYERYWQPIHINNNKQFWLLIGQSSYALYIIHTPIIYALNLLSVNIWLRVILAILISGIFTYIAEFHLHPPLARKILSKTIFNG